MKGGKVMSIGDDWPADVRQAVEQEINEQSEQGYLNGEVCNEIATRNNLPRRRVIALAAFLGVFKAQKPGERRIPIPPEVKLARAKLRERDYGVLQGAANVTGGCATTWGWAILIFCAVALLALITGQLN